MRLTLRITRDRSADDRELEQQTGIKPSDHQFSTATANSEAVRQMERKILGPSWGKKRAR